MVAEWFKSSTLFKHSWRLRTQVSHSGLRYWLLRSRNTQFLDNSYISKPALELHSRATPNIITKHIKCKSLFECLYISTISSTHWNKASLSRHYALFNLLGVTRTTSTWNGHRTDHLCMFVLLLCKMSYNCNNGKLRPIGVLTLGSSSRQLSKLDIENP